MAKSKIEWTEYSWNPVTGCTPISEGCQNCYARRMANRLRGRCGYPADEPFKVMLHKDRLEEPLHWKKPRRVFVCSMGDLFHEDVPFEYIHGIWDIIKAYPQHTFLILTKRPQRMAEVVNRIYGLERLGWSKGFWDHVWLGVTAENQQRANERIPILLQIPAAVRFVSVEPMLGPVDLTRIIYDRQIVIDALNGLHGWPLPHAEGPKLNWVICGGETGPGARPMHPDWVRSLRDQCQTAGISFFFKAWGEYGLNWLNDDNGKIEGSEWMDRMGKKIAGRILDGRTWDEMPCTQSKAGRRNGKALLLGADV